MTSAAPVEHPLTIAEIFDRAVVLCVQRWPYVVALCALDASPGVLTRAANAGRAPAGDGAFYSLFAVEVLISSVAFAALVRAFGEAESPAGIAGVFRSAVRDLPRSAGAYVVLLVAVFVVVGVAAVCYFLGLLAGRATGSSSGALVASLALGSAAVALLVPLYAIAAVAYPTTILERTSPVRGLVLAGTRVLSGGLRRSWLLGLALLVASAGPSIIAYAVIGQITRLPGLGWTGVFGPFASSVLEGSFGTALATVAAIDYRLRREGSDLQAVLEQARLA